MAGEIIIRTPQTALTKTVSSTAVEPAQPIKKAKRNKIKFSTTAIYASIFVLLVVMIAIGYRAPQEVTNANVATVPDTSEDSHHAADKMVDDTIATSIAAGVAEATNLSVAPAVTNLAISTKIDKELATLQDNSIAKPSIIAVSTATRNITTYTVVAGDTVETVAAKFGISTETLKWANGLTSNTLNPGNKLDILPRNGIVYIVKSGDTLESLASKYKADASLIRSYNDLEISGLNPGLKIVIPDGNLPATERPGYTAPTQIVGYSSGIDGNTKTWRIRTGTPMYAGNNYATGNCTAYVFDRRVELGNPVRGSWGNAASWAFSARNAGYKVDNTPSVGAVIQNGGGAGHVAIVEKILDNGDLELSEMNYGGGWNIVSGRILSAAYVSQYLYIH